MIYGKYWNDDQVVVANVTDPSTIPNSIFKDSEGTPAFIVAIIDPIVHIAKEYIFVEIIPGTEHKENFLNLNTGQFENGICVKINIYSGHSFRFEDMRHKATDSWPLAWFKLTAIPPVPFNTNAAYDRAMSVVGG